MIPFTELAGVDLGPSTGITGRIEYGVAPTYQRNYYDVYLVPVNFENGIATASMPVGVITTIEYKDPNDPKAQWKNVPVSEWSDPKYGVGSDMGVGVGSVAGGVASPVYHLPGSLADGLLIDMSATARSITFGGNPLEGNGSVTNWQGTSLGYEVISPAGNSSGRRKATYGYIDSGGLGGGVTNTYLPDDLVNLETLPPGTVVKVFTPDLSTLLYQTTISQEETNTATYIYGNSPDYINTGTAPFLLGPLYFQYLTADTGNAIWDYLPVAPSP